MKSLQILGPGCPKCHKLQENTETAAKELGIACQVVKVSDIKDIIGFGVMMTPALVVDGEVKVAGKVPSVEELKHLLA
ncbi:MAG: TM0996/MTH895 family glutaredoxin-like protein [Candidatus Hydrogenedentes bacterium]|nr:TM0996/MTH895 family glutaredoxin-like protein [Candidatus Hydrogenedentota bacterium]